MGYTAPMALVGTHAEYRSEMIHPVVDYGPDFSTALHLHRVRNQNDSIFHPLCTGVREHTRGKKATNPA